jgi:hypothetical protein
MNPKGRFLRFTSNYINFRKLRTNIFFRKIFHVIKHFSFNKIAYDSVCLCVSVCVSLQKKKEKPEMADWAF